MGNTLDPKLIDETLEYIMTKARDQDLLYFFSGLSQNKDHRVVGRFFKQNYDPVRVISTKNTSGADDPLFVIDLQEIGRELYVEVSCAICIQRTLCRERLPGYGGVLQEPRDVEVQPVFGAGA